MAGTSQEPPAMNTIPFAELSTAEMRQRGAELGAFNKLASILRATDPTTTGELPVEPAEVQRLYRSTLLGRITTPAPVNQRFAIPTASPAATWVAEGAPAPADAPDFSIWIARGRKLVSMSTATKEAMRTQGAASIIRGLAEDAVQASLDAALLDAAAGDETRPAGLLAGRTIGTAATPADAAALALAGVMPADPSEIALIAEPVTLSQAVAGTLFAQGRDDMPMLVPTSALPVGTIVAMVKKRVFSTLVGIDIAASAHASVTIAGKARSLMQEGLIALRITAWADWQAAPNAVAAAEVVAPTAP
jgi:hypothetical protein